MTSSVLPHHLAHLRFSLLPHPPQIAHLLSWQTMFTLVGCIFPDSPALPHPLWRLHGFSCPCYHLSQAKWTTDQPNLNPVLLIISRPPIQTDPCRTWHQALEISPAPKRTLPGGDLWAQRWEWRWTLWWSSHPLQCQMEETRLWESPSLSRTSLGFQRLMVTTASQPAAARTLWLQRVKWEEVAGPRLISSLQMETWRTQFSLGPQALVSWHSLLQIPISPLNFWGQGQQQGMASAYRPKWVVRNLSLCHTFG